MSKLIIIEGSDNTGKSTQASLLIKNLEDRVFQKLHYSSLPFKDDTDLHITYSTRMYDDMFKLMTLMKDNHNNENRPTSNENVEASQPMIPLNHENNNMINPNMMPSID